ncbi:CPBP family glutamic-type intramembrane protease [Marivirga tractuosa]|uniref:CPBP family glutamic-type intramembrane protease n=1 Tax=Marivirga tractuosa TaxID=1006 RepID=UPI0035D106E0
MKLLKKIIQLQPLAATDSKLKVSLRIYGLGLLVIVIFSIFKIIAADFGLYESYHHHVTDSLANAESLERILYVLLTSVIIYPLVEELSFRLWLVKNTKRFFLGLGFFFILILLVLTEFNKLVPINFDLSFVIFFISFGLLLAYLLFKLMPESFELPPIYLLIIISSILFALLHLNVTGKQTNILGYLIILLPYSIKGYFYGYINYRIGFRYSFLVHALHNFVILSISLLMK